jgi:hypothetical protein
MTDIVMCAFCGRVDPPGGLREQAQVSNPVTYAMVCNRRAACYLAAFRAIFRPWDASCDDRAGPGEP